MGARMTNGTCPGFENMAITEPNISDTCPVEFCVTDNDGNCGHAPLSIQAYIVPMILAIITFIGLVGNSIVVFVIFYQGQLKTVTNYYIVNLAITDLAFLIACAPFTAAVYASKDWIFGRFMCKFVFYLQQVTAQTTCITLVLLAIDRYRIILHPIESLAKRTTTRFCLLVFAIWTSSGLLGSPLISIFDLQEFHECNQTLTYCTEHWERWEPISNRTLANSTNLFQFYFWYRSYAMYNAIVIYIIPLIIISICYSVILSHLWKHDNPIENEGVELSLRAARRKKRTTRMILAVMFAFAICWFPLHAMNLWERFDQCFYVHHANDIVAGFKGAARGLIYLNSSINPILYAILGGNFRYNMRQIWEKRGRGRKQSTTSILQPHARQSLLRTRTTQV